ncbi:hypothetical protein MWU65_08650 [Cellulophaga sp. F20128]|uniref:DUF6730 family protein n=1 Tax=Cellulophaga sp. F20128 TaxID=2926413 RepID=UPI001FF3B137|nr:DUF6730 family protein [Cellulophaga sp. F20128]MCK0157242.1 hypothetical protein [Cellulophaga sp. F20128]
MTKLEELTALVVNELNDFKTGIEKLEKINRALIDTKIKMDLTEYKSMIETQQQEMTSHKEFMKSFENRFNNKTNQAKIYPTWAVVVFIVSLVFSFASLSYIILT